MKNKTGNILTTLIVLIVVIGGFLIFQKRSTVTSDLKMQQQEFLAKASDDLNNTNIDSIDNELDQNDFDAKSF